MLRFTSLGSGSGGNATVVESRPRDGARATRVLACRHAGLREVLAAHLSRVNNRPELALTALRGALVGSSTRLTVADADHGCDWIEVG